LNGGGKEENGAVLNKECEKEPHRIKDLPYGVLKNLGETGRRGEPKSKDLCREKRKQGRRAREYFL